MLAILDATNARGVVIWDLNDYFNTAYYTAGNPINSFCNWASTMQAYFSLEENEFLVLKENDICANYTGP